MEEREISFPIGIERKQPSLVAYAGEPDWLAISETRPPSIGPFFIAPFFPLFGPYTSAHCPFGAILGLGGKSP
jgi:hypothetical protein